MVHVSGATASPHVLVIMGSIRQGRICARVTDWVVAAGGPHAAARYEIIDLRDWPLPMDDEPGVPAAGVYQHPHTQAWSRKVRPVDAVVIVTPQYNWGYPA